MGGLKEGEYLNRKLMFASAILALFLYAVPMTASARDRGHVDQVGQYGDSGQRGQSGDSRGASVVKPGKRVNGYTSAEWLALAWKASYEPAYAQNALVGNGDLCMPLSPGLSAPLVAAGETSECTIQEGAAVMPPQPGAECSTVEEAPYYGSNPAELRACVRASLRDNPISLVTLSIDGRQVDLLRGYTVETSVFQLNLPADNILTGVPETGRAVAGGWAAIVAGLQRGRHVLEVHSIGTWDGEVADETRTVVVNVVAARWQQRGEH
jgi:hypothetical protein